MIQSIKNTLFDFSENTKQKKFEIVGNESMFQLLTKNIYSDCLLAVIREWTTNAIDACIHANKDIRYEYILNADIEMNVITFGVRDYGLGLSKEDLIELYTKLGASTKRNSNNYNGTFGIGRMAGFAVSDYFLIDSYYNGKLYKAMVSKENEIPTLTILSEQNTDKENGLFILANVKLSSTFFKNVLQYITILPEEYRPINYQDIFKKYDMFKIIEKLYEKDTYMLLTYAVMHDRKSSFVEKNITIHYNDIINGVVYTGFAYYDIPFELMVELDLKFPFLSDPRYKGANKIIPKVEIGELDISPSRETLLDTEKTRKALIRVYEKISKTIDDDFNNFVLNLDPHSEKYALLNKNVHFSRDLDIPGIKKFDYVTNEYVFDENQLHKINVFDLYGIKAPIIFNDKNFSLNTIKSILKSNNISPAIVISTETSLKKKDRFQRFEKMKTILSKLHKNIVFKNISEYNISISDDLTVYKVLPEIYNFSSESFKQVNYSYETPIQLSEVDNDIIVYVQRNNPIDYILGFYVYKFSNISLLYSVSKSNLSKIRGIDNAIHVVDYIKQNDIKLSKIYSNENLTDLVSVAKKYGIRECDYIQLLTYDDKVTDIPYYDTIIEKIEKVFRINYKFLVNTLRHEDYILINKKYVEEIEKLLNIKIEAYPNDEKIESVLQTYGEEAVLYYLNYVLLHRSHAVLQDAIRLILKQISKTINSKNLI